MQNSFFWESTSTNNIFIVNNPDQISQIYFNYELTPSTKLKVCASEHLARQAKTKLAHHPANQTRNVDCVEVSSDERQQPISGREKLIITKNKLRPFKVIFLIDIYVFCKLILEKIQSSQQETSFSNLR